MQRFLIGIGLFAVLVGGCGGTAASSSTPASSTAGAASSRSAVHVPEGPPPKKLVIKELKQGSGTTAKVGDEVEIQYVARVYATGKTFSVALPAAPFHIKLGAHEVVPGWERGILGMKVGGRRELIIPPRLAYGKEGVPPTVPPGSTLVVEVGLVGAD